MADAKTQYIARPDGSQTTMDKGFAVAENKEAEQFYSMCDPATKQSMFFVHHEGNAKVYYTQQSTMTVFGFGRDPILSKFPHGALESPDLSRWGSCRTASTSPSSRRAPRG